MNIYETDKLLGEYLLFHYGLPEEILPWAGAPTDALGYPQRCVTECLPPVRSFNPGRALDLGCAVGRSSFEFARYCNEVVGIDFSHRFIEAANELKEKGSKQYIRVDEGDLTTTLTAYVPQDIDRGRVHFEQGDAMNLREDLGKFDVVLMANLIDRLTNPAQCLQQLQQHLNPGAIIILTSPYTWLEEFTPKENWLGGKTVSGERVNTADALQKVFARAELLKHTSLPFLIREHRRKYQWSVADATVWRWMA